MDLVHVQISDSDRTILGVVSEPTEVSLRFLADRLVTAWLESPPLDKTDG